MAPTQAEMVVLTREQLFERVWTTPMRKLGPELGVTDVGLKKICGRFNIPTPGLGYWAKREHGKAPKRPRLPKFDDPGLEGIKFQLGAAVHSPRPPALEDRVSEREHLPANKIVVVELVGEQLPLVERTFESLRAANADEDGLVRPGAQKTLNVRVAPERVERAGRIMQALLTALGERGLAVSVDVASGATRVRVLEEQVSFGLHEVLHRQERPPTPGEKREMERWSWGANQRFFKNVPTGNLCLAVFSGAANGRRRRFTDSRRRPVENLLNAFVIALHRVAEDIKAERAREMQRRVEREEAERRLQEYRDQRAAKLQEIHQEEQQVAALVAEAERWQKAQSLRRYIDAVRLAVTTRDGEVAAGSDAEEWLLWATAQADRLDPLTKSPASIIDEKANWEREHYW